jgi:oligopeptide/dipeptide ABC transporter ATP-binding protein
MDARPVLSVRNLSVQFAIGGRWRNAIRNVSFDLAANETLALVGESGCGKSITCQSILGLLSSDIARVEGSILYQGNEILGLSEPQLERIRGKEIAMIFQEPMTALNPVMPVGDQIAEGLSIHLGLGRRRARDEAVVLMNRVRIPAAEQRYRDYPHQFSGGMRQRIVIAMAMACKPRILLADEPTTALDVTIQAQILAELRDLCTNFDMSMVFITHSLGVVAAIADRVAVMYAGEIVEMAAVETLFAQPHHPYTQALFQAIPRVDRDSTCLRAIPGQVPSLAEFGGGCRFMPRCARREDGCATWQPRLVPSRQEADRRIACRLYDEAAGEGGEP